MTEHITIQEDNVMSHFFQVLLIEWNAAVDALIGNSGGWLACYQEWYSEIAFQSLSDHCKSTRFMLIMIGRIMFFPELCAPKSWTYPPLSLMEYVLHVMVQHSQIIDKAGWKSINSCYWQLTCDPQDYKEHQASCHSNFQKGKWPSGIRCDNLCVFLWSNTIALFGNGLYSIHKTWKKWDMTLSSWMTLCSVMRDTHDARMVPMERGWVALCLHAKCKYSN